MLFPRIGYLEGALALGSQGHRRDATLVPSAIKKNILVLQSLTGAHVFADKVPEHFPSVKLALLNMTEGQCLLLQHGKSTFIKYQ